MKERICLNFLVTARVLFASNGNSILGQAYNAQIGELNILVHLLSALLYHDDDYRSAKCKSTCQASYI